MATIAIVVAVPACTDDETEAGPAAETAAVTPTGPALDTALDTVTGEPASAASAPEATTITVVAASPTGAETSSPTSPPAPSIVAVTDPPQTGVPGAGDDDYCTAVGTIVLSDYLVGLVEAFGDPAGARRAEAAAASTVLDAFARAVATPVASDAVTAQFEVRWRPLVTRAAVAVAAFGSDPAALEREWGSVLAGHDRNDPVVVLSLDPGTAAALDEAAAALDAAHGPLTADPVYLAAVSTPTPDLDALLATRCPDVAALTAGDAV